MYRSRFLTGIEQHPSFLPMHKEPRGLAGEIEGDQMVFSDVCCGLSLRGLLYILCNNSKELHTYIYIYMY